MKWQTIDHAIQSVHGKAHNIKNRPALERAIRDIIDGHVSTDRHPQGKDLGVKGNNLFFLHRERPQSPSLEPSWHNAHKRSSFGMGDRVSSPVTTPRISHGRLLDSYARRYTVLPSV